MPLCKAAQTVLCGRVRISFLIFPSNGELRDAAITPHGVSTPCDAAFIPQRGVISQMTTTDESVTDESTESTTDEAEVETETTETETEQPDPHAGAMKALAAERKLRKAAEKERDQYKADIANKDKPAEEQALEAARREAAAEASAKANSRIVRAEVKAAATGKVKNPALALKLIDISEIEVDDDGEVDSDAVNQAIADLLAEYPELSADGSKFGGSADQGAKGKESKPTQLSKQDLESMSAEEINAARREGRLKDLGV